MHPKGREPQSANHLNGMAEAVCGWLLLLTCLPSCGGGREGDDAQTDGLASDGTGDAQDDAIASADGVDNGSMDGEVDGPVASARCGDGVVDPDEECDDGNRLNGDECDWACRSGLGMPVDSIPEDDSGDSADLELTMSPTRVEDVGVLGVLGAAASGYIPFVWDGGAYATVVVDVRYSTGEFTASDALFIKFATDGRVVGPGWRYHQPLREFASLDLAFDGTGFAMVWCGSSGALTFVALDAQGKPESDPVDLVSGLGWCDPKIVWDGEAYAVAWTLGDAATEPPGGRNVVGFLRVTRRAELVSGPMVSYEASDGRLVRPRLATSGDRNYLALEHLSDTCIGLSPYGCLRYLVLSRTGELVMASSFLGPISRGGVRGAWSGDRFSVLWSCGPHVAGEGMYLASVGPGGDLLGPPVPVNRCDDGCQRVYTCGLAWGRSGWGILVLTRALNFIRTDRDGVPVDVVRPESGSVDETCGPANIAFDGEGFGAIAWCPEGPMFWRYSFAGR